MNFKKATAIVVMMIPLIIALILIYDAVAVGMAGNEASISSYLITRAYKMPFMVYCIGLFNGILVGHLFWRMRGNKDTRALNLDTEN